MCEVFDKMGSAIQASIYGRLLGAPGHDTHKDMAMIFWGNDPEYNDLIPAWQRVGLVVCYPLIKVFMRTVLKLNDPRTLTKTDELIWNTFQMVSDQLKDGRKFLFGGESPSMADITFCALSGPLILPPQYAGYQRKRELYGEAKRIPKLVEFIDKHRSTRAGQWVLDMYGEHRPPRSGTFV